MTVGNLNCNQGLYDSGLSFARALPPSISGWPPRAVLEPIANRRGTSVAEVRTAIRFVDDVKLVSSTVGAGAKALLLSGMNPILTPVLIGKIAKLSPARMKSAIGRAEAGLNPFAGPIPAGVPRGQAFWHHDLLRLHQANELLEDADSGPARLSKSERDAIYADATAIKVAASAVLFRLESDRGGEEPRDLVLNSSASDTTNLPKRVKSARKLVEAVTHDLPLLMTQHQPAAQTRKDFVAFLRGVHSVASRIATATRLAKPKRSQRGSVFVEVSEGPDGRPGTYVMVMRLTKPVVLRIGRLETFWLPAGYLLYVGSAFGGGGVQSRTERHRESGTPKMWNLDHIKAVARPVEIWWTHSVDKVECRWAVALAELPGYRCPAPGCGSNDCKTCPAHFYHRSDRPPVEDFAEHVGQSISGLAPIYRRRLD